MGLYLVMTRLLRNFVYKMLKNFSRGYHQAFRPKEYKMNLAANAFTGQHSASEATNPRSLPHMFFGLKLSLL